MIVQTIFVANLVELIATTVSCFSHSLQNRLCLFDIFLKKLYMGEFVLHLLGGFGSMAASFGSI